MKKRIFAILAAVCLLSLLVFTAQADTVRLDDEAALLFGSEAKEIGQLLD